MLYSLLRKTNAINCTVRIVALLYGFFFLIACASFGRVEFFRKFEVPAYLRYNCAMTPTYHFSFYLFFFFFCLVQGQIPTSNDWRTVSCPFLLRAGHRRIGGRRPRPGEALNYGHSLRAVDHLENVNGSVVTTPIYDGTRPTSTIWCTDDMRVL